jgi:hypothetical protein
LCILRSAEDDMIRNVGEPQPLLRVLIKQT